MTCQRAVDDRLMSTAPAQSELGGKSDAGTEQRRLSGSDAICDFRSNPALAAQPHEGAPERVARHPVGVVDADALRKRDIVYA